MIVLAIVFALLVLIILSLPFLLDLNRYRGQYLPILEQALQRKIDVEDVRLTLFPKLGLQLRHVVIAEDPAVSSNPFLTVPSMQVSVQWRPLLQRRIQVESVVVENPVVQIIRLENGGLNTATIGKSPASGTPASKKATLKSSVSPLLGVFAVEQISMTGGTLHYEDRTHQPPKAYQIENLELITKSVAIGQTAVVRVTGMVLPYQMPFDVKGRFGPLQANLDIPEMSINGHAGKVAVTAQGKLVEGRLTVDVQIPEASTDDVPIELGLRKPVGLIKLQAHLVAPLFRKNSLPAEVTIDPFAVTLHFGNSDIHLSGKGTPSRFSLTGDSSSLSSQDFPIALPVQQPFSLEQLQFAAEIQGARFTLQSLKAKAFDGTLMAKGMLDGSRFSLEGTFKNFLVEPLVKVIRSSLLSITGVGELEWNVSGVVTPSRMPELQGPVHATIRNGVIMGFDFLKAIETALQMPGVFGESTGMTKFSLIDANTVLEKDGVDVREFIVNAPNFSLRSAGKIGLDQSVALKGTLAVPPFIADKITQRFPLAHVVRQEGQLVLPFIVKGTVQNPVFRLDTKSLGNQVRQKVEERLKKVLKGDKQELQKLLNDGRSFLKHLFRR